MSHHSLDIISCLEAQRENDRLKLECQRLRRTNADLLRTLLKSQQEVAAQALRNKKLQNELSASKPSTPTGSRLGQSDDQVATPGTLGRDHSRAVATQFAGLRVRLEKEQRKTSSQAQRIANLEAACQELEVRLQWGEEQCEQLKADKQHLETRLEQVRAENRKLSDSVQQGRDRRRAPAAALQELARVSRQRSHAEDENTRLRAELSVIDKDFFKEIEDMKLALQQSLALNRDYEQALRQVCQKYRLPFPDVRHPP